MSKNTKRLLIFLSALIVLCAILMGLAIYWFIPYATFLFGIEEPISFFVLSWPLCISGVVCGLTTIAIAWGMCAGFNDFPVK